ncbi:activating signal cointegrator 1 complex subunit 2-like [Physella acuta]|uniref:activating signal cointegrator 1 complex subunit 2-like n=1 Tax=Physella acuta TaxID=109671 RepID=UPI0027DEAB72|nr:activating signal cointegrator 1 complex subunit 2-like [Physella acuta]
MSTLPSLHPSRAEKMIFVKYTPPPLNVDRADYDAWLERVNYLSDDLHWLLQLPHEKFWCQVVYDASLHEALDSFLQYCPRSHDIVSSLPENVKDRHQELCRLVFMTYLRMSTFKESKDHSLTPEVFGEILYENFLFDIPKIIDICSLFGQTNGQILSKMIGNIFTHQPKYLDDLRETVPTILQVLRNIAAECGLQLDSPGPSPQKLDRPSGGNHLASMPTSALQDVILYLSDTAVALNRFLDIYPPACAVFHQFNFCSVLANFYECMVPELTAAVKVHNFSSDQLKKQFLVKVRQIKKSLVTVFRLIIQHTCIQPILENGGKEDVVGSCAEDLLHTMTSVLGERQFLAVYEGMFCFQDDVDMLLQTSSSNLDSAQFDYIQSAINSAFATYGRRKSPRGDTNTGGRTSPDGAPDSLGSMAAMSQASKWVDTDIKDAADFQTEDYGEGAVAHPRPNEAELESLITSVKDLFPDFGEGFIELALEELDWNHEKVVSSILEDKLPPSLAGINRGLQRQERTDNQGDGQMDLDNILDSRRNIFDNDEFDIFHNKAVDFSKIHVGKKDQKVDIDDKTIVTVAKEKFEAYGNIDQDSMYDNQQMYEDEYDDTYDTNAVGADDVDSADELSNAKVLPRVLMELERKKAKEEGRLNESSDDDGREEERQPNQPARDEFVADPAKLREQAEQRRQSKAARGRHSRGGAPAAPRNRDVVGNAKGQGQSEEVLRNRQMKTRHKGQYHKAGADRKMSKGMF